MALVCSCYHDTSKWHPKTIITLNYFSLLLRHVEELSCYFRHRLSAMQLVKRFVKITFLMDELSGKENELHSLHDVMHSEVEISSLYIFCWLFKKKSKCECPLRLNKFRP